MHKNIKFFGNKRKVLIYIWNDNNYINIWIGLTALAQALDSKQAHTSFGKLPLSIEKTAPAY